MDKAEKIREYMEILKIAELTHAAILNVLPQLSERLTVENMRELQSNLALQVLSDDEIELLHKFAVDNKESAGDIVRAMQKLSQASASPDFNQKLMEIIQG